VKIVHRNGSLTADDLLRHLALTGQSHLFAEAALVGVVLAAARQRGLAVSDDQLQQAADRYRADRGLYAAAETLEFLRRHGLTDEDLERFCEYQVLAAALKDQLAGDPAVEAYFVVHRGLFDRAKVSVIRLATAGQAEEVLMRITEDGEDFGQLARQLSLDPATRPGGGYLGEVSRATFPPPLAARVFNARPGDVLGPFEADGGAQLLRVEGIARAELTGPVRAEIRERIFLEWTRAVGVPDATSGLAIGTLFLGEHEHGQEGQEQRSG